MNIEEIVNVLENGGLAIFATDTTYGIMADATNDTAVKKIFDAKKRLINKPLVMLVSNRDMLNDYILSTNDLENDLINEYSNGPLTIIFKKSDKVSNLVSGGLDTIGIRIPNDNNLIQIMNRLNKPIVSTSANISGESVITNISEIDEELLKYIDYVCDSGEVKSMPSTIVKVDNDYVNILREGILADTIKNKYKTNI